MSSWSDNQPLSALFYGKSGARGFARMFDSAKRLALIKRRHRAWLKQQAAGEAPLEDESTGGDMIDLLFG